MPRYPKHEQPTPEASQEGQAQPIVRRLSSSDIELAPVAVRPVAQETIELMPDPVTAAVNDVLEPATEEASAAMPLPTNAPTPEVVELTNRPVAIEDRPLHLMTREELMERLNAINAATQIARPLNELPGPRPAMTDRQRTQREAELARGAERVAQNAANQGPRRPPLTAVTPGRPQSGAPAALRPLPVVNPPVPASVVSARAPDDNQYAPDMNHGYIESPSAKAFNESHKG